MSSQLLSLLFQFSLLQGSPVAAPSAEAIEQAALNQRRALSSGDITIKFEGERWIPPKDRIMVTDRVRFSKDKIRVDSVENRPNLDFDNRMVCRNCEKVDYSMTLNKRGRNLIGSVQL